MLARRVRFPVLSPVVSTPLAVCAVLIYVAYASILYAVAVFLNRRPILFRF
jgi:hypothetical protein